jgi:RNA polymerase sigma factor (sigma-70 family)
MSETYGDLLEELRPVAFAIAYRMLGSVAEAEDIVQEALLRLHRTLERGERIESPRAYVATVTTRLAIDELRSARARRETYVGEWLPEPFVTDAADQPSYLELTTSPQRSGLKREAHPKASPAGRLIDLDGRGDLVDQG